MSKSTKRAESLLKPHSVRILDTATARRLGISAVETSMVDYWKAVEVLADALAAEEAHTPTDDEREALIKRLEDEVEYRVRTAVALSKGGHDHEEQARQGRASVRFLTRSGFRRTEVPEPSAVGCSCGGALSHKWGCQGQGEPSEAWQREHGRHWWACAVNAPRAEWVGPCDCDLSRDPSLVEHSAALRAAGEVGR